MDVVAHVFAPKDVVAGHPVLDFVNTVTARDKASPRDWLDSYVRFVDWADLADVLTAGEREGLRELATAAPREAAAELRRIKALREALHALCGALISDSPAPAAALEAFDAAWRAALGRTTLRRAAPGIAPTLNLTCSGLCLPADQLSLQAVDLLSDFPAARARVCRGEHCGWLFIDTSKAGRRVWCDMATCGNAAKTRRHLERRVVGRGGGHP